MLPLQLQIEHQLARKHVQLQKLARDGLLKQSLHSVTKSSSGLIFVNIRAVSGQIFSKNPGKIRAKIRAKLKFCDVVVFLRFRARSTRYFAV